MNLQEATIYFMSRNHTGRPSLPVERRGAAEQPATAARILVVEDEYFVALTIEDALVDAGHEVVGVVASGEEALDAANELQPELVLMDIRLKGEMTGIDAALELRRRGVPSIFASAHSDETTKEAGGKAQPAGWLVKPFSHAELVAAVRAALARIRSN
jgi:two-component system, response regulator PdtaR